MRKGAYYNDNDKYVCQWLRNLIAADLIAHGDVDERSIKDVKPDDLRGYTQCHFFAGIGGWSYALKLAGWPDDRPVWTGSCPCQPLSIAGKVGGVKDERHLWPELFRLICERRPTIVFGEQVASSAGCQWLAGVHLEMESETYSFGAANLCAAGVKAKHPRQRLFFVANAGGTGLEGFVSHGEILCSGPSETSTKHGYDSLRARICFEPDPGTLVRIDGLPRPVGQVRAFGNAIVPQIAAQFISAFMALTPKDTDP